MLIHKKETNLLVILFAISSVETVIQRNLGKSLGKLANFLVFGLYGC